MKYISLIILLVLSSCSLTKTDNNLPNIFQEYEEALLNKNYILSVNMISRRNQNDLVTNSSISNFTEHFPLLSSVNLVLSKKINYYQKIENTKGCLTITGLDVGAEPASINIEFVKEKSNWNIDYIQVMYHSSMSELLKYAVCPEKL